MQVKENTVVDIRDEGKLLPVVPKGAPTVRAYTYC